MGGERNLFILFIYTVACKCKSNARGLFEAYVFGNLRFVACHLTQESKLPFIVMLPWPRMPLFRTENVLERGLATGLVALLACSQ